MASWHVNTGGLGCVRLEFAGWHATSNITRILLALAAGLSAGATFAAAPSLPTSFTEHTIESPEGAKIFVRHGGSGPAVLLLHGYGETSDMWGPLAAELAKTHVVIVPDLRGLGRSSRPAGG